MDLNLPQNIEGAVSGAMPPQVTATPPMAAPGASGMTPDQMIADLESKAAGAENKNAALKAKEITGANNQEAMRAEIIQDLFKTLEKYGVDPNDPESIRTFLEKLAETDPDLFEVFETAFMNLTAEPGETPPPSGAETMPPEGFPPAGAPSGEDQGLMNKFGNLAGGVMR